jgi:MoaA/NifB/PqqE/SkfB family radical SAM enzyme
VAIGIDIEPTNRCNAKCYFCPRDATPHQGLMSPEVFEHTLARCVELQAQFSELGREHIKISFCGLGEPLLNRHTPSFVRQARDAGFPCTMSSNAALLDERRSHALLEAGLQNICINVGERDDDYEEIYKLPFERTRDNILRFKDLADGTCETIVVLVDHRQDRGHVEAMRAYWRDLGLRAFMEYEIMNRGGALFVDHMQFESYPELAEARAMFEDRDIEPMCPAPFVSLFVGYDGQHYLCCSDWKKEVPLGSVYDTSFVDVMRDKLTHVRARELVCRTCNLDPLNQLTDALRARAAGETVDVDVLIDRVDRKRAFVLAEFETLTGSAAPAAGRSAPGTRRTIPVTAV